MAMPSARGDGATGALVNIAEIRRHLGSRRQVRLTVAGAGWSLGSASVVADAPVQLDLDLESVNGGVTATGTARFDWTAQCRRCLEPVGGELEIDVDETFAEIGGDDETYPIHDDVIDMTPLARDAVLLALPLAPLCRDGCRGPAPDRFEVRVEVVGSDAPKDPRWAALDELLAAELDSPESAEGQPPREP